MLIQVDAFPGNDEGTSVEETLDHGLLAHVGSGYKQARAHEGVAANAVAVLEGRPMRGGVVVAGPPGAGHFLHDQHGRRTH